MNPKKYDSESLVDYKIRICSNKTLLNLTWVQVSELLNKETGQNFGESAYRKWFQNFNDGLEYATESNAESNEVIAELKAKTKELEIAKIQFADQKREAKHYLRHEGRLDHLLKTMLESIKEEMNTKKPLEWVKPIAKNDSNGALTLLLSDLHRGQKSDNHWNKFDETVFDERMNQVANETVEYQKLTGVKELHIMQLGDLIEGTLHRLTKIGETETAVEQTQRVSESLSELVSYFANHFEKVHFYSVKGNHDRVSSRKEEEIRTESFHDFVTWYMKSRLDKHENVVFHENDYDSEIIVAEICGKSYFGVHGHLESYGKVIHDLTMMIKKFPEAVFGGHIHQNFEKEVHGVDLIVNGGFAGTNGYAKDKRLHSKAHQKLLWLDENGRRATFYLKFNK